ncbi:MAG: zinc ribbon domain-containing protein [Thermoguttaceae bacterium]|jgi:hypothetical protein
MTKCPACGEENPPGVGLCKHCGGPISLEEDVRLDVPPGSLEEQILGLLQARKKIEAVQLYREKTGAGLREAVVAVETLAKQYNLTSSKSGCAGVLLIVAAAVFILLKYTGVA